MTWIEYPSRPTFRLSRMFCGPELKLQALWKLTSPSRTCTSSKWRAALVPVDCADFFRAWWWEVPHLRRETSGPVLTVLLASVTLPLYWHCSLEIPVWLLFAFFCSFQLLLCWNRRHRYRLLVYRIKKKKILKGHWLLGFEFEFNPFLRSGR